MLRKEGKLDQDKVFVVNSRYVDRIPMSVDSLIVELCDYYIYLGSPFTADVSTPSAIKLHAELSICQCLKFAAFIDRNNDLPFNIREEGF